MGIIGLEYRFKQVANGQTAGGFSPPAADFLAKESEVGNGSPLTHLVRRAGAVFEGGSSRPQSQHSGCGFHSFRNSLINVGNCFVSLMRRITWG